MSIRAVLFAKDLERVAGFYAGALGMACSTQDEHHAVLQHGAFELVIHRIPDHTGSGVEIWQPPKRRENGVLRLDFPVTSIAASRALAKSLGGDIDDVPPIWAAPGTDFFLGFDPEGNVFGVSQQNSR